jgi:predicted PurR-regulated permease PerM
MNFFKIKTRWSNAELVVLKLCIASAYILVGTYFHKFFHHYYIPVLIAFVVTVVWSIYLWITKMKVRKESEK